MCVWLCVCVPMHMCAWLSEEVKAECWITWSESYGHWGSSDVGARNQVCILPKSSKCS